MWNCNTLVDDYIAEARIEENGNESGISKELQLFGRKKEAAMEKPGKMKIHICSSNDLQYLWFESGHFGNSNLPLVATILEKCSRSKERFPFTSSISALFGMREHTDLLIYFFLVEYGSEVFEWLVIWGCRLSHFDGTIPRSVILLFMCIFWRILFTNSDDWLEQLLMWFLRLSHMWWIHFFN